MKKIVIIGSNSSIARNFRYFIEKEDVAISLYDVQDHSIDNTAYPYRKINFLSPEDVSTIDFDCDYVYLFSGKTGAAKGFDDPMSFVDINEKLLLIILKEMVNQKSHCRIIYPSSRLVYDDSSWTALTEESKLKPKSIYAAEKIAAENYLALYHNAFNLRYTVFRIAIPFGELHPMIHEYGIVSNLVNQAKENKEITLYGDGGSIRTFSHIVDICAALWYGGTDEKAENETFNIGGCAHSLKELAERIAKKYGACVRNVEWPALEEKLEVSNGWLNSNKLDRMIKIEYKDIEI